MKSEVAGSFLHKGFKGTVLPLLSASHETGVKTPLFQGEKKKKSPERSQQIRQVKLEAERQEPAPGRDPLQRPPQRVWQLSSCPSLGKAAGEAPGSVQAGTRCGSLGLGLPKRSRDF